MNDRTLLRRVAVWLLPAISVCTLGGCISASLAAHPYSAGWRVLRYAGEPDQMAFGSRIQVDCRQQPHANGQRFVLLQERDRRSQFMTIDNYWLVPAVQDAEFHRGEEIFANARDCSALAAAVDG